MKTLEHKIPPPIVAILIGAAMWGLARISPAMNIDTRMRVTLAGAFFVFGGCVTAMGMLAFRRARTTMLLGWTVFLSAPLAILGPIVFVLFTARFQIIPEERVLTLKFGRNYTDYQQKVRRWL